MKMLKQERAARDFIRAAIQNDCDKPTASSLITATFRAVRADEQEKVLQVARECHHFHRCNHYDPCGLCRLMNPNWEPIAIREGCDGKK